MALQEARINTVSVHWLFSGVFCVLQMTILMLLQIFFCMSLLDSSVSGYYYSETHNLWFS